jgi:cell filamentation protein
MTREGYDAFDDPYVYKGTDCLKNRLGLRDVERLEAFELEMSSLRAEEDLPNGHLGPAHYKRIHRHLFHDVYAWAGQYRKVRTGKGGNWFCYPEYIASEMNKLFHKIEKSNFLQGTNESDFLGALAAFLAELNAIHPFRDGNGRTQLAFAHLLAAHASWPIDLGLIDVEAFVPAMIKSFLGNIAPLRDQLQKMRV